MGGGFQASENLGLVFVVIRPYLEAIERSHHGSPQWYKRHSYHPRKSKAFRSTVFIEMCIYTFFCCYFTELKGMRKGVGGVCVVCIAVCGISEKIDPQGTTDGLAENRSVCCLS